MPRFDIRNHKYALKKGYSLVYGVLTSLVDEGVELDFSKIPIFLKPS